MDTEPLFEVDVRHFEPHSLEGAGAVTKRR